MKKKLIFSRNPSRTSKAKFHLNIMPEEYNTNIAEIVIASELEKVDEATLRAQNKDLQERLLVVEEKLSEAAICHECHFLFFSNSLNYICLCFHSLSFFDSICKKRLIDEKF